MSDKLPDWYDLSRPVKVEDGDRSNVIFIVAAIVVIGIYLAMYFLM